MGIPNNQGNKENNQEYEGRQMYRCSVIYVFFAKSLAKYTMIFTGILLLQKKNCFKINLVYIPFLYSYMPGFAKRLLR